MKNLWSKTNFVLISILLINSVISPVLGAGMSLSENPSHLIDLELNIDDLSSITSDLLNDDNPDASLFLINAIVYLGNC